MATNLGYPVSPIGLTKIIHIVFGIISLGCVASTYESDEIRDRFFFGAVITCFLVSLIYFIVHIASYGIAINPINKAVDMFYHLIGALLLITGASLFLEHAVSFNGKYCSDIPSSLDENSRLCGGWYHTRLTAGAFGLVNSILYLVTLVLRGIERDEEEEEEEPVPAHRKPKL